MSFTYGVLLVESIAFALLPMYLGRAVDGLFDKDWFWFGIYLTICVVSGPVGTFRRCVDTRIFGSAWGIISTNVVGKLINNKMDTAKIITRAGLSTRFVDFFEYALPEFLVAVVGVIVPIGFLWANAPEALPVIVVLIVVLVVVSLWISHKEKPWDNKAQTARDDLNQAIEDKDMKQVGQAYDLTIKAYIKRSDWGAANWLTNFLIGIGGEVAVIVVLADRGASPGEVLTAIGFVWNLFSNVTNTTDIFGWIRSVEVADELISEGL